MERPMTLAEKCVALVRIAEQGRDREVYSLMEMMLRERPDWVRDFAPEVDAMLAISDERLDNMRKAA